MNKEQKAVEKAKLQSERKVLEELKKQYKRAAEDIQGKINIHTNKIDIILNEYDTLDDDMKSILQAQIYQKQYQEQLKLQVDAIIEAMNDNQYDTIQEYLDDCYNIGFIGTAYDLHGQGIPLIAPIDQKAMLAAVTLDPKLSAKLYGTYMTEFKRHVVGEISRGIATADSFEHIARNISNATNMSFNKTMRIVRTEGHGIQIRAAVDMQEQAKKAGADVVKQWDAQLDARTRNSHARLDGEIRELDERFSNGMKYPSDPSGGAAEVINCRCALLQRAKWGLDEEELDILKQRAEYFGLDKTDNFNDFQNKFLNVPKPVDFSVKSSRINTAEPLSRYLNSSEDLYENAKKVKPIDGYEDIFIHGDKFGFAIKDLNGEEHDYYSVREFADILREDPNYHGGAIRLLACEAGAEGGTAAQNMANLLNVNILAPTDVLWVDFDGSLVIGPDQWTNTGEWKLFKPQKRGKK